VRAQKRALIDVLRFLTLLKNRGAIKLLYEKWRHQNGIPTRCDNPSCIYHTSTLEWNKTQLPLILDHINGNSRDNRPENLRFLCPNCDAQLPTRGGKNKGRVQNETERGYQIVEKNGRRDALVVLQGVEATCKVGSVAASSSDQGDGNDS